MRTTWRETRPGSWQIVDIAEQDEARRFAEQDEAHRYAELDEALDFAEQDKATGSCGAGR